MNEFILIIEKMDPIIQAVVLLVLIILMLTKAGGSKNMLLSAFYVFSLISLLLSDLYWIAYSFLRPGTRMPFAANEIGESALFLLAGAVLSYAFRENKKKAPEAFVTALFVACNAALWYGWSGELIQDILSGIVLAYYMFVTVNASKYVKAFTNMEFAIFETVAFLLVAMQGLTFILPEKPAFILDRCCYCVMFAGAAYFAFKLVKGVILFKASREQGLCVAWMAQGWITLSMYMSAGLAYSILLFLFTVVLIFTYITINRVTEAEGKEARI